MVEVGDVGDVGDVDVGEELLFATMMEPITNAITAKMVRFFQLNLYPLSTGGGASSRDFSSRNERSRLRGRLSFCI